MISPQTMLRTIMGYLSDIANTVAGGKVTVDLSDADIAQLAGAMAANPLTDTQLRASAVPITGAVTTTGTVTEASASDIKTAVQIIDDCLVAQGTTAPSKINIVGGKSNDGTPQYKELPLGAGARSVIVEGISGGTAVPGAISDGADVTLGAKADAKSTATDTTPVTAMQVLKEISYMEQNPAMRAVTVPLNPSNLVPNSTQADQALTVDATAGGVQFAAFHADTTHVILDVQTAQVRVTFDGSAPTATDGHILEAGDWGTWSKALAVAAKFIRTGATSATIHCSQTKGA